MIEADDLVTVHARDKKIVSRVVRWIARFEAQAIRDAPAAQMLAGPRIGKIGRGKIDAAVGLFDDEAADVAVGKFDRQRQTNWAGAGDQNGNTRCHIRLTQRLFLTPSPTKAGEAGVRANKHMVGETVNIECLSA